ARSGEKSRGKPGVARVGCANHCDEITGAAAHGDAQIEGVALEALENRASRYRERALRVAHRPDIAVVRLDIVHGRSGRVSMPQARETRGRSRIEAGERNRVFDLVDAGALDGEHTGGSVVASVSIEAPGIADHGRGRPGTRGVFRGRGQVSEAGIGLEGRYGCEPGLAHCGRTDCHLDIADDVLVVDVQVIAAPAQAE